MAENLKKSGEEIQISKIQKMAPKINNKKAIKRKNEEKKWYESF